MITRLEARDKEETEVPPDRKEDSENADEKPEKESEESFPASDPPSW